MKKSMACLQLGTTHDWEWFMLPIKMVTWGIVDDCFTHIIVHSRVPTFFLFIYYTWKNTCIPASKSLTARDLKPENILVHRFGLGRDVMLVMICPGQKVSSPSHLSVGFILWVTVSSRVFLPPRTSELVTSSWRISASPNTSRLDVALGDSWSHEKPEVIIYPKWL